MAKGIRALLDTVMQALPQVGNLGLLFFLLFFIFAALGVELFGRLGKKVYNGVFHYYELFRPVLDLVTWRRHRLRHRWLYGHPAATPGESSSSKQLNCRTQTYSGDATAAVTVCNRCHLIQYPAIFLVTSGDSSGHGAESPVSNQTLETQPVTLV